MSKVSDLFAEVCSIVRALQILFRKPYRPTQQESEEYWNSKMRAEMGMQDE
jgi:hypothetical protein